MILPDKLYSFLKWFCLIGLNAFGVLYATLGKTWGLPYVEQIPATCNAIGLFIGTCIGVSHVNYYGQSEEERSAGNDQ